MSLDVYLIDLKDGETVTVFDANITHNLNQMADVAGIYEALWRPELIGAINAYQIIAILEKGIKFMQDYPEKAKQYNAKNGWGTYEQFLPWVKNYLEACKAYPNAIIEVSR